MHILGISIDKPFLRLALVEKKRGRYEVLYLKSPDPSEHVKQLYTGKEKIASALPSKDLFMRQLEVNTNRKEHLEQVIAFQSDATSHFNPSDVLSVPLILQKNKEKTEVLLFTASREKIREHLQKLEKLKIDPDSVSITPLALIHYIQWKNPQLKDFFIVDLGSDEWTCACAENGELKKFHSIDGGIEALLAALWEDRKKILFQKEIKGIAKQIDLLQLKASLNSHLSSQLTLMRQDLAKAIFSFYRLYGQKPIFFTGRVDAFGSLEEYLTEGLKDSISQERLLTVPKEEQKYAISIGLAVGYHSQKIQFRKDEFFSQKNWKRAGLYALCLCSASLLMTMGLIGFAKTSSLTRKQEMVSYLHSSLKQWEVATLPKIFVDTDEEEILSRWDKSVSINSKESPFLSSFPKVSQVLSWLYQLPILKEKDASEISSIRYQLQQYPKIDTPKDPFVAKLEIEFKIKSVLQSRRLHEEFLQGNGWVDGSQEIQWDDFGDFTRVSFFLKKENFNAS